VATNDTGSTVSTQTRVFSGYCRDADGAATFQGPAQKCWENGMAVGPACSGTYESCEQRSTGAFGPNGGNVKTITAIGRPQAELYCGAATGTRVGVFSMPPTLGPPDGPSDLPGPGAITMPGVGVLCAMASPCGAVATSTTTTSIPGGTTTSTSLPAGSTTSSTSTTSTSSTTSTTAGGCCNSQSFVGFTAYHAPGDCGDLVLTNGMILANVACTGFYLGGGLSSAVQPIASPDLLSQVLAITSCSGQVATLGATTSLQTGSTRNCSSAGCLFGAPFPVPNPNSTPTSLCLVNSVATAASGALDCASGATNVTLPLAMGLYLTGDADGAAGIQTCPRCLAGTCAGGPNNGMACTPGTSAINSGYPTSQDCPPAATLSLGTLPIAFAVTTGTLSWTGTVATNDTGSTVSTQTRVFSGYCRDVDGTFAFQSPAQKCWENGAAVGPACSGTYESCEQRNTGAFGPNGGLVKTITAIGTPAAGILAGTAGTTLAALFSVPPSPTPGLDSTYDLPGPGAVTLTGSTTLCASASACP